MRRISLWRIAARSLRGAAVLIPVLLLSAGVYFAVSGAVRSRAIEEERARVCRVTVSAGRTEISAETEKMLSETEGVRAFTPVIQTEVRLADDAGDGTATAAQTADETTGAERAFSVYALRPEYIREQIAEQPQETEDESSTSWALMAGGIDLDSPAMLYTAVNLAFLNSILSVDVTKADLIQQIPGSTYEYSGGLMLRAVAVIDDKTDSPAVYLDYDAYSRELRGRGEAQAVTLWADLAGEDAAEAAAQRLTAAGYICITPLSTSREAREYALKSRSRDLTDAAISLLGGICAFAAQEAQRRRTDSSTERSYRRLGLKQSLTLALGLRRWTIAIAASAAIGSVIYMLLGTM